MSGTAEANGSPKRSLIGANDEPPAKQTAVESVPSPEVAELQHKLLQSDNKLKHMCKMESKAQEMVEELRARVKFLENITGEGSPNAANNEAVMEELKKKVSDLNEELKKSKNREAYLESMLDSKEGVQKNANNASAENELKKKIVDLERQLDQVRKKSAEIHRKLAHFADLEKKVNVLETDLKEANKQSTDLKKKLVQVDSQLIMQHRSIAATLASVVVPTSSADVSTSSIVKPTSSATLVAPRPRISSIRQEMRAHAIQLNKTLGKSVFSLATRTSSRKATPCALYTPSRPLRPSKAASTHKGTESQAKKGAVPKTPKPHKN